MNSPTQHFITHWLISGVSRKPFHLFQEEPNQIKFEQLMRTVGMDTPRNSPPTNITLGSLGLETYPWQYYHNKGSWFVELNTTSATPYKFEAYAYTELYVEEELTCEIALWSYPSIHLWVNEDLVTSIPTPVYKPMQRKTCSLHLKPGTNTLFIQMQNIGMRDTRNLFGIELLSHSDLIKNQFTDSVEITTLITYENYLSQIEINNNSLVLPYLPELPINLTYEDKAQLLTQIETPLPTNTTAFSISLSVLGHHLSREFRVFSPELYTTKTFPKEEVSPDFIYQTIAKKKNQRRGSGSYFSVFHVLARYATNSQTPEDISLLHGDLELISQHIDCSDFLITGFIRLMKQYDLPQDLLNQMEHIFLQYRYWMDEDGCDGMCFWSENHSLMFHSAQMFLGQTYATKEFLCSHRLGLEQFTIGRDRCLQWLTFALEEGFEEFNSATYTSVTIAALLNIIDYADSELATLGTKVLDQIFDTLFLHIFDDAVIAPQGRVYGDVITPALQKNQDFIFLINPDFPISYYKQCNFSMWLSAFATTTYELPTHLINQHNPTLSTSYLTEHCEINLTKCPNYLLTSVSSPRENFTYEPYDVSTPHARPWVKDMNMRFHGRTCFEPGVYGYQQHMWYAALDKFCVSFVNHPGVSSYHISMRPGYWYGNGIMPALKQVGNTLMAIHNIDDAHPIHFTHTFWPQHAFDQSIQDRAWLFGSKKDGFMALWCSGTQLPVNNAFVDCEYRCYDTNVAYACIVSQKGEFPDFTAFMEDCKKKSIQFTKSSLTLCVEQDSLTYSKREDTSQYI